MSRWTAVVRIRLAKLAFLAMHPNLVTTALTAGHEGTALARRRARRAVPGANFVSPAGPMIPQDTSIDLSRFDGIGPEWFWEFEWKVPTNRPWIETYALEVAQSRWEQPC